MLQQQETILDVLLSKIMSVSHPHIKRISWTLLIPLKHPTAFIFRFYEENRAHLDLIMVLKPIKNGYKLPNLNLTNWHFSPLWLAVMGLATPWWWGWKNSRVGGSISVCGLFLCLWFMIMGIPTIRFNNQIQYHTEILFYRHKGIWDNLCEEVVNWIRV